MEAVSRYGHLPGGIQIGKQGKQGAGSMGNRPPPFRGAVASTDRPTTGGRPVTRYELDFLLIVVMGACLMWVIVLWFRYFTDHSSNAPDTNQQLIRELRRHKGNEDESDSHT